MKQKSTRLFAVIFLTAIYLTGNAQIVVNITSNTNSSIYGPGVFCTNCIVNISPGDTLFFNSSCGCNTCRFIGGTVDFVAGSSFALSGVDSFKNETVLIHQSFSAAAGVVFYGDTVAFDTTMSLSTGRTVIDSSRVSVNSGGLTLADATFNKDSLHLNSNLTLSFSVDSFSNSNIDVASGVNITASQTTIANSVFGFAGSSSMTINFGMTSSGSKYYLTGTSAISSANATSLSGDSILMSGTTSGFTSGNGLTTTNTNFTLKGTASTLSAQSLNSTGGSITAASGSTISVTNGATLSGTATSLTGTVANVQSLTYTNGSLNTSGSNITVTNAASFTGTTTTLGNTRFTIQSLTTSGGTFNATGDNVNSTNAISLTNTPTTITGGAFTGSQLTTSGGSFSASGATVTSTFAVSMTNTPASFTNSIFSGSQLTTSGSTFSLNSTKATISFANSFSGTAVTMSGTSSLTGSAATLSSSASLTMTGNSSVSVTNAYTSTGSNTFLYGTDTVTSGSMSIGSSSYFDVGSGSLGTTANSAFVNVSGGFNTDNTSTFAIASYNNYLHTTNSSLKTNTISCGGGAPQNPCTLDYVYGCATIKNNVGTQCTVLALASITLSAANAGEGKVALSWTDNETSTGADHYSIQRSTGNDQWNAIGTIAAGSATGDYYFTDANAPAGALDYRIERTDANGNTLYSSVSSVDVALAVAQVSIHPNPASGGRFYVTTPGTGQIIVNVFTTTGQLLLRTSLKGQTQYPVELPSQLLPGTVVIVETISLVGTASFPLLLR
jgi:trimeric autotransporter adhesin